MKHLGNKTVEEVFWCIVRQSNWVFVALLGFVSWADVADVNLQSWGAIVDAASIDWKWLLIIALASLWVGLDLGGKAGRSRSIIEQLDLKANYAIVALGELRKKVRQRARDPDYITHYGVVFEPLLQAAVLEYRTQANVPKDVMLKANLLLLTADGEITVVARSSPGSPVPVTYEITQGMPAAIAITFLTAPESSTPSRS